VVRFIHEAKTKGIPVLPPDVNESEIDFSVADNKIRFGLAAIKGVGIGVVETLLEARAEGRFTSLYDLCSRVDLARINRRTLEAFIKCGALDSCGPVTHSGYIGDICESRTRMLAATPIAMERAQRAQRDAEVGQTSIFGMMTEDARNSALEEIYPEVDACSDRELLADEKALIGFYVTGHPLDQYHAELGLYQITAIEALSSRRPSKEPVRLAVVVNEIRERPLKSGQGRMAFLRVEDKTGQIDVVVFRATYETCEELVKSDSPLLLTGSLFEDGDGEGRVRKIRAQEMAAFAQFRAQTVKKMRIDIDISDVSNGQLGKLRSIFEHHPGQCRTYLRMRLSNDDGHGFAQMALAERFSVEASDGLILQIERLFRRPVIHFN
jgi:DNA polymerase-3 subunit alpha